jgi:hypothetical protein
MRLRSLSRLLEVVAALVHSKEVTVLGSSSLLACDPGLGEAGQPLELSMDADILIEPYGEREAALIHEAIGEGSLYHQTYGVYADIMRPEIEGTLPQGWRARRLSLGGMPGMRCLEPYDLAVVKLVLGRAKDIELLRSLLAKGVLDINRIRNHYQEAPMNEADMFRAGLNLQRLAGEATSR